MTTYLNNVKKKNNTFNMMALCYKGTAIICGYNIQIAFDFCRT